MSIIYHYLLIYVLPVYLKFQTFAKRCPMMVLMCCVRRYILFAILNSTEMEFWRRSARISKKDKIRNTIIKQKMNVTRSLLDDIKTEQLQWYSHVQRMEEGRLPKEVVKWRPLGIRRRGRPKLTWAEGIKGLMGEKVLMEEDGNDGSNWRKKII
jgi:hypothetical protein